MKPLALISVSDKTGIDLLAAGLVNLGFEIISTGKTASYLSKFALPVTRVSELTGFPEIMDGRVKTLHPGVHAGILADRDVPEHTEEMDRLGLRPIDLVAVNLYPFAKVAANPGSTEQEIIENIDIGGPTLIRSAAKNFKHVTILTDTEDYAETLSQIRRDGNTSLAWRCEMAAKAFRHVAQYDKVIAEYFTPGTGTADQESDSKPWLDRLFLEAPLVQPLRYGENPHQRGGYFSDRPGGWTQLHGKPLSFNNLLDLDAALKSILLYERPTAMIFKHTNPCGIGSGGNLSEAYQKAFATDPLSPFGGILAFNRTLDLNTAAKVNEIFSEIIIAPDYGPQVLDVLRKRKDRRLICFDRNKLQNARCQQDVRSIITGYLVQDWDNGILSEEGWQVVTKVQPTLEQMDALRFAWKAVSILKSNAIALTAVDRTIGLGMGQTSRVDSAGIAIRRAIQFNHDLASAVCASDGFFPFRDSVELLAGHGIKAVIQPGGSKNDAEVIAACDGLGMCMVLTGMRHFRH